MRTKMVLRNADSPKFLYVSVEIVPFQESADRF